MPYMHDPAPLHCDRSARLGYMLLTQTVQCPYCNESYSSQIDISAGEQEYVEDCYICCRPVVFRTILDQNGDLLTVEIQCENP